MVSWITSDHLESVSDGRSLFSLQPTWWKDPKVDCRGTVTHAKDSQLFFFSYFSCFHWQNFFPVQSRAANVSSCPKWKKFKDQRRKRKEVGVKWGKQLRTTRGLLATLPCTKVYGRKHTERQMAWWQPWAKWCTHIGFQVTTEYLYFYTDSQTFNPPRVRNISKYFPLNSGGHFFGPRHTVIHVSESFYRWKSVWNYCINFFFWFHYLMVIEKI